MMWVLQHKHGCPHKPIGLKKYFSIFFLVGWFRGYMISGIYSFCFTLYIRCLYSNA